MLMKLVLPPFFTRASGKVERESKIGIKDIFDDICT